jgi:hypothetical protein
MVAARARARLSAPLTDAKLADERGEFEEVTRQLFSWRKTM